MILTLQKKGAPAYEALSYVWGSEDNPSHVDVRSQLNTEEIVITKNLDVALRHLRYKEAPRYLWVDALCINQANNAEKSKQVAAMGTIFKTADRVTAWLGSKENNSDLAMAWFLTIGRNLDVDWKTSKMRLRREESTEELTAQQEPEMPEFVDFVEGRGSFPWTKEDAKAVFFLLVRPYFGRAWIAQELRLAKHVFFQCGEVTIPESCLWVSMKLLNRNSKLNAGIISPERWFEAHKRVFLLADARMQGVGETLFTLRQNLGHLLCNDARDKIYSALCLMDLPAQTLAIVPSYALPTEQVYTDIARRAISQWSDLEIFVDCELSSQALNIPSWVPDWSTPAQSKCFDTNWSACAYVAGRPSFNASGLQCTVSGVSNSQIIDVNNGDVVFGMSVEEWWQTVRSWSPAVESLNDVYLTGERLIEVYCRTLVWNSFSHRHLSYAECLESLTSVWREDKSSSKNEFTRELATENSYFRLLAMTMRNRTLLRTSSGRLGLAPAGARLGDVVCVLLGCRFPVVLRPAADHTYQVVGTSYIHGLMNGETIYENEYTRKSNIRLEPIDPATGRGRDTGKRLLEKAGLRVDGEQKEYPWACSVSDETLLAAGIRVEDFVLV